MTGRALRVRISAVFAAAGLLLLGCSTAPETSDPSLDAASQPQGQVIGLRRLTEAQYRNSIADIFGADIKVGGRFEPIVRPDHELIAAGAAASSISPAGFEQFDVMARAIAEQVVDERHRPAFLTCQPADPAKADPACARSFFRAVAPYLLRRPPSASEIEFYVALAGRGAEPTHDFYKGLSLALGSLLVSPQFLYRVEAATPDGKALDGFSKASRLSFLIWDSAPDAALLRAAARGDLDTQKGLRTQVDRMLASAKAERGVRAFFTDFLQLDQVADLTKDTVVYRRFTQGVAQDLKEQALLTIVDHLVARERPYPELFTTRKTFMNRRLGLMYKEPVAQATGWQPYELPAGEDRAGLLGQGAFLALFSHEGRSSPTLRGRAIREVLMCQPVPNPPANVDFSGFNDTSNAVRKTARQRLSQHMLNPVCAGCHKITDPLGLPLERFDGVGTLRDNENGAPIDVGGSFEGKTFEGAAGLGYLISQSPAPSRCVSQRMAEYATGRTRDKLPKGWVEALFKDFQAGGYRYRVLIEQVALSPEFYATPDAGTPATKVADMRSTRAQTNEAP